LFTFKNNDLSLNIAIVLALSWPSMILILAFMSNSPQDTYTTAVSNDSVGERIRPVVTLDDILGPESERQMGSVVTVAKTPEALYQGACLACHAVGVANAPKFADKAAWEPKAALGMDTLLQSVISGKGAMPPKGGSAYSEEEIRSVIEYMLAEAGLS
jgi:cytochrome c5